MNWEHRVERINFGGVSRFEKLQEQLNALGPEGWEAVAALSSDGNTIGLILKRQISDERPGTSLTFQTGHMPDSLQNRLAGRI
jgi:hypothetical protein